MRSSRSALLIGTGEGGGLSGRCGSCGGKRENEEGDCLFGEGGGVSGRVADIKRKRVRYG